MSSYDHEGLLIDWLYQETFNKRHIGDPLYRPLRTALTRARRCVLTDEMAAFLYKMMTQLYVDEFKDSKAWHKRIDGRLDDGRYFSRLPHPVTWVEYKLAPMISAEIDRRGTMNPEEYHKWFADARMHGTRIGWLMEQHD